jgi:Ca2+-transporting ATPase
VFGWPLLFFPVHVLFLEFVIDPACAFVFEADPESDDIMRRKPRRPDERLFSSEVLKRSVLLGAMVLAFSVAVYGAALTVMGEGAARGLAFIGVVIANLALIFVSRSRSGSLGALLTKPNRIFWWITGGACLALALSIYAPPIATLFLFTAPAPQAVSVVAGSAIVLVLLAGGLLRQRL